MTNFTDMLQELNLKRERRVSRVRKNFNNNLETLVKERGIILEQVKVYSAMTKKTRNESNSAHTQVALQVKKQAELSDEERLLHQGKKRLEAECQEIDKEKARNQQYMIKMKNKEERFGSDKENKCSNNKLKGQIFLDLTGICWDYSKINSSTLKGYVQNKNTCRLSEFDLMSNHPTVGAQLWAAIGNAAASK